tara:strand:- start:1025 stop:1438 length:414 start_codon:yes stop_codon:yes gene_type:complete
MKEYGYEKLKVYKLSFSFVADIYKLVNSFQGKDSSFIISQLKRASASMPLNIAEGSAALTKRDYLNHVNYAYKSSTETKVILKLCKSLGYINEEKLNRFLLKLDEIKKRIYCLRAVLMKNTQFKTGDRFKYYLKTHS